MGRSVRDKSAGTKARGSRAEEVLDVAVAILIEDGYANLTFRSVAQRASIGIGNLQHYFPTKDDLIRAMLTRAFDRFALAMAGWKSVEPSGDAKQALTAAVSYILEDQKSRESCVIFWELWALASHDPGAAQIMSQFYQVYVSNIAALVRQIRPDATAARAARASTIIAALLEGASLFRGHGRPREGVPMGLDKSLKETILMIVENA
jgi:AcrR family transcriptional regulator